MTFKAGAESLFPHAIPNTKRARCADSRACCLSERLLLFHVSSSHTQHKHHFFFTSPPRSLTSTARFVAPELPYDIRGSKPPSGQNKGLPFQHAYGNPSRLSNYCNIASSAQSSNRPSTNKYRLTTLLHQAELQLLNSTPVGAQQPITTRRRCRQHNHHHESRSDDFERRSTSNSRTSTSPDTPFDQYAINLDINLVHRSQPLLAPALTCASSWPHAFSSGSLAAARSLEIKR